MSDLEALVEPTTRGDPESPLRWTCKSVRRLAEA
jgi:Rhodopirellula transposase DDE domain